MIYAYIFVSLFLCVFWSDIGIQKLKKYKKGFSKEDSIKKETEDKEVTIGLTMLVLFIFFIFSSLKETLILIIITTTLSILTKLSLKKIESYSNFKKLNENLDFDSIVTLLKLIKLNDIRIDYLDKSDINYLINLFDKNCNIFKKYISIKPYMYYFDANLLIEELFKTVELKDTLYKLDKSTSLSLMSVYNNINSLKKYGISHNYISLLYSWVIYACLELREKHYISSELKDTLYKLILAVNKEIDNAKSNTINSLDQEINKFTEVINSFLDDKIEAQKQLK